MDGNSFVLSKDDPNTVNLLFLALKFLQQYDEVSDSVAGLELALRASGAFGNVVSWDGTERKRGIEEVQRMFPDVPKDQLARIVGSSGAGPVQQSRVSVQICRPSNLHLTGEQKVVAVDLMRRWADMLGRMRSLRLEYFRHKCRLGDVKVLGSDPTVDLTTDESGLVVSSLQSTLREIGRERVTGELEGNIIDISQQYQHLSGEPSAAIQRQLRSLAFINTADACRVQLNTSLTRLDTRRIGLAFPISSAHRREIRSKLSGGSTSPFANFRLQWTVCGHMGNPAYCSVFDQTGNFLLTGADDYLIKIWDVKKGLLVRSCKGHLSYISLIAVSPDNSLFASCCTFGTIRVWRMSDGVCLKMMKHNGGVNWIKFDASSCALASASDDGQCIVWDLSVLLATDELESPLLQKALSTRESTTTKASSESVDDDDDAEEVIKGGLFDWSTVRRGISTMPLPNTGPPSVAANAAITQQITGILPLPHVSDEFGGGLVSSSSIRVVCLDICTVAGVVVTGSDDAVARIWRFDQPPIGNHRYPYRGPQKRHDLHRGNYTQEELHIVQRHLLLRLEGHIHPVTDVQFNSMGDRVVTGSNLDGTVRIWSMDRNYTASVHLILDLSEQDDVTGGQAAAAGAAAQATLTRSGRRGGPRTNNTSLTPKVHNVAWTCDDARIITVQSITGSKNIFEAGKATRLKVWDAMTGDLLRIIWSISEVTSGCLVRHPFNPCFAVTAGEDGFVNVWNIEGEELVAKVALKDDDDRPAEIIDVSISNDATRIAATDKKGRVSFISLDNPEKFKHFPYGSQYFSTDYTDIFHDAEGFAFDVGTQLPLHLSPIGLLCRSDGSAYEIQPPKLFGPPTLSVALVQQSLEKINDDRLSLWKEMDRVYEIFNHNKRTNRLRIKYRSAREDANHADSKLKAAVKSKPTSNVIFRSIDELSDTSTDSAKDSDYQSGGHHSNDENTDDMDGSSSDSYAGLQLRRSSRAHRPTNYSDAYDEEEVDRALLSPRSSRRRSTARRLRRGGYGRMGSSEDDDDDDDDGDNDVFNDEDREGRSSRRHRRGGRRRIVVDDDDVAAHDHFAEGDEYVGDEDDDGGAERSPRRRVHRAVTSSSSTGNGRGRRPDTAHSSRSRNSRGSSARDGSGSGSGGARGGGRQSRHGGRAQPHAQTQRSSHRTEKWIADESGVGCLRIPLGNEAHRAWLQCDLQYDMLYVPQLGDEVVYVPQGHAKYLESFPEEGVPACNRFRGSPFVECTVVDIRYVFPNQHHYNLSRSVVALVTLAVTGTPTRVDIRHSKYIATVVEPRATRRQEQQLFVVSLRSSSCADYVIPKVVFHRALTVAWHPNLRITSHFCDTDEQGRISFKEYAGVVLNLEAAAPEWPLSPWMNLLVQWDADDDGGGGGGGGAEETSLMSFWEVQPDWPAAIARDSLYMKMKLPSLAPTDCARIADDISQLMETHPVEYSAFEYEPDPELYPDYSVSVPLPMTLNLVVQRLRNGYYRQMVALEHDIQLIVNNCRVFNVDDAPITVHALQLQEEVSLIIRSHCAPPHTASLASMTAAAAAGDGGDVEDSVVVGDRGTRKRGREQCDHEVSKRTRATAEPASASLRLSLGRRRVQHDDNEEEEDEGDAGDDNEDEGGGGDDDEEDDDDEADEDDDDDDDAVAPGGRKLSLNLRRHGGATTASAPLPPVKKDQGSMRLVLGRGATTAANRSKTRADSDEDSDEASAAEEESDDDSDDDSSEDSALNRRTTRRQQSTRSSRFKLRSSKPAAPPAPSSRIRGRGRLSVSDDDEEDDDDDDDDESADVKGPRRQTRSVAAVSTGRASRSTRQSAASTAAAVGARSQRGRRSSRSHADDEDDDDDVWKDDDDDDDDDDAEDQDDDDSEPRGRTTRRSSIRGAVQKPSQSRTSTRASSSSKPSKRSAIVPSSDEEEEEEDTRPTRRSQRGNTASKRRYGDEDSDEEEEEEADEGHTKIASTRRRPSRATTTTTTTTTTAAVATNEPAPRSTRSLRRQTMDVDEEGSATRAASTPQRRAVTAFNSRARQHISPPPPPTNSLAASTRHRNSDSIFANADVNEGRRRLTADMKRQINDVLDIAAGFDTEAIFQEPVDTDEIEGYLDIVAEPMDFTTIRGKLKRLAYSSVQDVILDILLIYDNCVLFNGDDDYYGRYAIRQKKQFVAYLRKQHIDLP